MNTFIGRAPGSWVVGTFATISAPLDGDQIQRPVSEVHAAIWVFSFQIFDNFVDGNGLPERRWQRIRSKYIDDILTMLSFEHRMPDLTQEYYLYGRHKVILTLYDFI